MAWNCIDSGLVERESVLTLAADLYKGNMRQRKSTALELLDHDHLAMDQVKRVMECSIRWRCNSPFCHHCSVPTNSYHQRRVQPGTVFDAFSVNYVGPKVGEPMSRNYRVRAGQMQTIHFDGLSRSDVGAVTVMLGVMRGGDPYREMISGFKDYLRMGLWSLGRDAMAYLRLEFAMKYAGDIRQSFPHVIPGGHYLNDIPEEEIVALVHGHGLVYVPGEAPSSVGVDLRKTFTGKNQVHIRTVMAEQIAPNGIVTGGAQGYAEYAGKKKTSKITKNEKGCLDSEPNQDDHPDSEGGGDEYTDFGDDYRGKADISQGGEEASFTVDLEVLEPTGHRDSAIAVFAEAEIFRALHRVNMTVRVGVNRKSEVTDDEDQSDIDERSGWRSVVAALQSNKARFVLRDVQPTFGTVCSHHQISLIQLQDASTVSHSCPKIAVQYPSIMAACGSLRYNSTRSAFILRPCFVEPKWVRFQRRVSFGRDDRPP